MPRSWMNLRAKKFISRGYATLLQRRLSPLDPAERRRTAPHIKDRRRSSLFFVDLHQKDFISSSKALHELKSYKFLAEGLKIVGQVGVAIGVLRHGLTNVQKKTPGEESWRLVFEHEIVEVTALLRKYEHENDFVWREKIPDHDELPIPEGKKIVSYIAYHPQRWERSLVFKL